MSEAFDIYTLLFLVLAVVIFMRLRNVLGRRTGNERPPYDPYSAPEQQAAGHASEQRARRGAAAWPRRRAAAGETSVPSVEDIEAKVGSHAPKDSALAQSLTELMRVDPGFDPGHFLDGAKAAYEMIVMSFADGRRGDAEAAARRRSVSTASRAPSASARRKGEKVEVDAGRHRQGRHHRGRGQEPHRLCHREVRERARSR